MNYSSLSKPQITQLQGQGCTAADWQQITISPGCDLSRLQNVRFSGTVAIGDTSGTRELHGVSLPCGIYDATIDQCTIGNNVRIANIGTAICRCTLEDGVLVQDVGMVSSTDEATYGNGIEVDVVNEGGGRGTTIFNRLTSQVGYLLAMRRNNPDFNASLRKLVQHEISSTRPNCAVLGRGSRIVRCESLINVVVGPFARVEGAAALENGTINSCEEHPTIVGSGVQARDFVIAEGARVESGALLDKVFVGQGVKMGKQFSCENSLFFANCEAFHGEVVSVFAGPYTVTHHKSTLLIAGLFSFYNAGSGTNQSNHMYKLGPVHQGIFERGSKTGSFSYVLYESHIGAFSVVIGKHLTNISAPNLPFSTFIEKGGESSVIPGLNLFSVGTIRDGEKWPKRDNRKTKDKRDLIRFDVFSPYIVEKMRRGRNELLALHESTSKDRASVPIGGVQMNRALLRKGAKYYDMAITRYLCEKVLARLCDTLSHVGQWKAAISTLRPVTTLRKPNEWTDLSGLLAPTETVLNLEDRIAKDSFKDYQELLDSLAKLHADYAEYEWQYVCETFEKEKKYRPSAITKEQALALVEEWVKAAHTIHSSILEDSKKEFGGFARIGYGLDLADQAVDTDFTAVRGTIESNAVVQKLAKEVTAIAQRGEEARRLITEAM